MSEAATGRIHDLGYKRYAGARLAANRRWLVILRNQLATSWKTWWRFKASLGLAVITTCIAGGIMFVFSDRIVRGFAGEVAITVADFVLPRSIHFFATAAFFVSLTIGSRVVANDVKSGAFTFYFARSVRPRDYVLGKLGGMFVLLLFIQAAGPLTLALARLGLSDSTTDLIASLDVIPKALGLGVLGALSFAAVPLAFSSIMPSPRYATALWAAYYLVYGSIVSAMGEAQSGSWLGALDLTTALDAVAFAWFDVEAFWVDATRLDGNVALASLLIHSAVAAAVLGYRVREAHGSGVGGSS